MVAVRAARLFDGVGPDLVEQPLVVFENGRVAAVQSGGEPPAGAEVVDLGDVTLLPGLIDTHIHLTFNASKDVVGHLAASTDDEILDVARASARATLASGVTTVRDLGDRGYVTLRLREETAADPSAGPQILAAGPPITTPEGHCWFLGGVATGVDGVRAAVREHAARGVDVIKMMATGGDMTPGSNIHATQYTPEELAAAADEAHKAGLPITAHAHAVAGIGDAVTSGFDMIEHCFFVTPDGVDFDLGIVKEMADRGVIASLTLGRIPGGPPPPPHIAQRIAGVVAGLGVLREAGVTIACGSDNGIFPVKAHGSFPYSVTAMVDMGFTPLQALRATTSTAAEACRVGDRKGRIAPGYDADLIAVAGDPLADIESITALAAVFRAGERVV